MRTMAEVANELKELEAIFAVQQWQDPVRQNLAEALRCEAAILLIADMRKQTPEEFLAEVVERSSRGVS